MIYFRKLLFAVVVITIFSVTGLSQTQKELNETYGEPKDRVYLLEFGIVSKVSFDRNGQAEVIKIFLDTENVFGVSSLSYISRETALKIIENLTVKRRLGKLKEGITFSAGCTTIENSSYQNVHIGKTLVCSSKRKPEIVSISIRWKKNEEAD